MAQIPVLLEQNRRRRLLSASSRPRVRPLADGRAACDAGTDLEIIAAAVQASGGSNTVFPHLYDMIYMAILAGVLIFYLVELVRHFVIRWKSTD